MRLRHTTSALLRAFQLSNKIYFLVVEGLLDRAFYSRLVTAIPELDNDSVQIRLAHELDPVFGNGKTAVKSLYKRLRRTGKLTLSLGSSHKAVVFMLDKDVDDLQRSMCKSKHVIYTDYYGLENYIFRHGDIRLALINGAFLDDGTLGNFPPSDAWTRTCVEEWIDWLSFCLVAIRLNVGIKCFGTHKSLIHDLTRGTANPTKQANLEGTFCKRTSMSASELGRQLSNARRTVAQLLRTNSHDKVFNGKWYFAFLVFDASRLASGRQLPSDLPERLEAALFSTLNFSQSWADSLRTKLLEIREKVNRSNTSSRN